MPMRKSFPNPNQHPAPQVQGNGMVGQSGGQTAGTPNMPMVKRKVKKPTSNPSPSVDNDGAMGPKC